jgi:hypothetical protein
MSEERQRLIGIQVHLVRGVRAPYDRVHSHRGPHEPSRTERGIRHCHMNRFYWSVLTTWQEPDSIKSTG